LLQTHVAKDRLLFSEDDYKNLANSKAIAEIGKLCYNPDLQRLYALFLIALSEGSLVRCENRLLLLPPPDVVVPQLKKTRNKSIYTLPIIPVAPSISDEVFTVNGVSFKMIAVQGGTFTMGAPSEQESEACDDEMPTHQVTLSDYRIGETVVTQELWQAVMGSNPSDFEDSQEPVVEVSWEDCQMFIKKLNQLTGNQFRLPTEAEWEYAARGGNISKGYKYAGSNDIDSVAWYCNDEDDEYYNDSISPVRQLYPNELEIYDMSGNVSEWCQDWYGRYSRNNQINPVGSVAGSARVIRGGGWDDDASSCRVSARSCWPPSLRHCSLGLRLAL
jgi:formylglycine-generating enzyme required for sulfatase activity